MNFKTIISQLLLACIGLLFGLLLIEGGLRLIGYFPRVLIPAYLFENHPQTWWALTPDFSAEINTPAGPVTYQISSQGLRTETTFDPQSGANQQRLFLIGDSFTFGWGVDEADTFAHLLDIQLPEAVDVVNLGVPGFGTFHAYERLLEYSERLGQPDVVIYTFVPNDPVDNISGKKVVVNGVRMDADLQNKRLLAQISHLYQRLRIVALTADLYYGNFGNPRLLTQEALDQTSTAIEDREDFLATTEHLTTLITWAETHDVELLVFLSGESVYAPPLKAFLQENSVPFLSASDMFAEAGVEITAVSLTDGHWNPEGHRIVADGLADYLQPWFR